MRRRGFLAGLPVGLLALSACGPEQGGPAAPAPTVENPEPVLVGELADVVEHTELRLPLEMTPMVVVDPGWTATPLQLDGVFLGYREEESRLRFLAVEQDGTVLWRADRPLTCTGYVLTRGAEGEPVAVLADAAPTEDAIAAMSLTAYDLRTAERLWGPVAAPGPQAALGLVYAAPTDQPMGAGGPRTALSASTGEPVLTEEDLSRDSRILGEHLGAVLRTEGGELRATGADGGVLWRSPLPAGVDAARARLLGAVDPTTSFAVISDPDSQGAVIDLADGRVIAEGANAVARDHVLEITVFVSGTTVRGLEDDGTEKWIHEDPEPVQLLCAGERLAYAVRPEEGTLVVLDTNHGLMVHPYDVDGDAPLAVPQLFSADTASVVRVEDRRFLVTTEFDENYGLRE